MSLIVYNGIIIYKRNYFATELTVSVKMEIVMYERFYALDKEKQDRIINAAMNEFNKGGYQKASMNDLTAQAGISKGALFYYFGNKKRLYFFLYDYAQSILRTMGRETSVIGSRDLLDKLETYLLSIIKSVRQYPHIQGFIASFKNETHKDVIDEVQSMAKNSEDEVIDFLLSDFDSSLFRDDMAIDKVLYTIQCTLQGVIDTFITDADKDLSWVRKQIISYMGFFRQVYYKD